MRHRASSLINIYGLNYCADHSNGKIYELSSNIFTDDGMAIIKQRDTAVIHGGLYGVAGQKLYFDEVEFIIVSGETDVSGIGPQQSYFENTYTSTLYPVYAEDYYGVTHENIDVIQRTWLSEYSVTHSVSSGVLSPIISYGYHTQPATAAAAENSSEYEVDHAVASGVLTKVIDYVAYTQPATAAAAENSSEYEVDHAVASGVLTVVIGYVAHTQPATAAAAENSSEYEVTHSCVSGVLTTV